MRKITVLSMISLDGVIQAPGSPTEDPSGNFTYGGWVAPYNDEVSAQLMKGLMEPADVLLGRHTFEIWENYWPQHESAWPGINEVTKYVFSTTREQSDWQNTVFLNDLEAIRQLRSENLTDPTKSTLQVWGSSKLVQLLLRHDLVDELWLLVYPLTLGKGKKLFSDSAIPAAFKLVQSTATPSGVVISHYKRGGDVKTGTIGE